MKFILKILLCFFMIGSVLAAPQQPSPPVPPFAADGFISARVISEDQAEFRFCRSPSMKHPVSPMNAGGPFVCSTKSGWLAGEAVAGTEDRTFTAQELLDLKFGSGKTKFVAVAPFRSMDDVVIYYRLMK